MATDGAPHVLPLEAAVLSSVNPRLAELAAMERSTVEAAGAFGLRIENRELSSSLARNMARVDGRLSSVLSSSDPNVDARMRYLLNAGGKRFRPLLTLLAATFGDADRDDVVTAAAAGEITHLATLYHDDVMDEASARRGVPSANASFGNPVAVLCGDLLFTVAAQLMAQLGLEAVRVQVEAARRLVAGQSLETVGPDPCADPVTHYRSVVSDKTGSLTAACAALGALTAGCSSEVVHALLRYGELIGVAFQLSDDLLDVLEPEGQTGKAQGTDLREGVRTLPVIYAQMCARPDDARLMELLESDLTDPDALADTLALLQGHPGLELARTELRATVASSQDQLRVVPAGPTRDAMWLLADLVGNRRR